MDTSIRPDEKFVTLRTTASTEPVSHTSKPSKVDLDSLLLGTLGIAGLALWFLSLEKLAFVSSLTIP